MARKIQMKIINSEYDRTCWKCKGKIEKDGPCVHEKHLYEVNPISYYYHPTCFAETLKSDSADYPLLNASFIKKLISLVKKGL